MRSVKQIEQSQPRKGRLAPVRENEQYVVTLDRKSAPRVIFSGEDLVVANLPEGTRVVYPPDPIAGVPNRKAAIRHAINHPEGDEPLHAKLRPGMKVTIAIDDISLPLPPMRTPDVRQTVLEIVLELLADCGVDDVHLIIANSLHRRMTEAEMKRMVGPTIFDAFYPDRYYNHDAEDPANIVEMEKTAHGEVVAINRRAAESDLLIYLNLNLVPMDGGHKSVGVGLCNYASVRAHHTPHHIRKSHSYMDPEKSELHRSVDRIGRVIDENLEVFHIETVVNNRMFEGPVAFLGKNEDRYTEFDRLKLEAMRYTLKKLPRAAKRKIFQNIPAGYELIGCFAGKTEPCHEKTLELCFRQYAVPVHGQSDVVIAGIPYITPYNVNSILNPVLVQVMALGYLFNLFRGEPLVKKGGTIIVTHPCPDEFDPEHHPSYIEFFHRLLPETRDAMVLHQKYEQEFAENPSYVHLYRKGHAYHGAHPFFMWYWGDNGRQWVGRVIVAGAENTHVPEALGWEHAETLDDAIEMARGYHGRSASITLFHSPPIGLSDVTVEQGAMPEALDIAKAFEGKRILLAGSTGFLGKVVLSMLLDRYPGIGQLIVLARPGTHRSAEARFFEQVLPSHPFDPIRDRHGSKAEAFFREKIRVVAGDVTDPDLGLDAATVAELSGGKLAALLNCAGLVTFDPSLELALNVNTIGAGNAAALCVKLGAPLVHVSTCFVAGERHGPVFEDEPVVGSYPRQEERDGTPLDVPREIRDCEQLVAQTRALADDGAQQAAFRHAAIARLREEGRDPEDERTLKLAMARERKLWLSGELVRLGMERAKRWGWPNTYTFSKSLGEQLIAGAQGLRYALARPSIVESALRYPFPGWNEGFTTSAPLAFLGLKGFRQVPAGDRCILDLIPVDLVAAGLLTITAAAAEGQCDPVYQLASGDVNPFWAARAVEMVGLYRRRVYRRKETGRPLVNKLASRLEVRPVSHTRYQLLSAPMVQRATKALAGLLNDAAPRWGAPTISAWAERAEAALEDVSREAGGIADLIELFVPFLWENHYIFRCDRLRALHERLPEADRAKLPWDPEKLDWRNYFMEVHMSGLERWVFPGLEEERDARARPGRAHRDLLELFYASTEAHGPRLAFRLVAGEDAPEEQVTYQQARVRAERVAACLQSMGVARGDRVLILSENRPEWPIAFFGILAAGAVAVPLDPQLSAPEVQNLARASGAQVALISREARERLQPNGGTHWIDIAEAMAKRPGVPDVDLKRPSIAPDDAASLIFTSGTTGKPKGVLLSHRNFAQVAHKLGSVFDLSLGQGVLSVLPLHHTFEFSCGLLVPFARGAEITYLDELTADRLGEVLETGRIHAMVGVPALWQLLHRRITQELAARPAWVEKTVETLMAGNRELRDRMGWNLGKLLFWPVHRKLGGKLRVMVSGGSALSEEVHEAFRGLGFDLTEGYGLTEAAPVLTVTPPGEKRLTGSVGRALPGIELRIASPDVEGIGEVLAKGANVMVGYFGDREATDAAITDGWLHTGDLGRLDEAGNLYLVGRQKDVIIDANGKNVYPDELEELYLEGAPEGLRELSIVGLPDESSGEKIACLVSIEKGAPRREIEEHMKSVSAALPFFRRIKIQHLWEGELPKTATRKVKRALVAEELIRLEAAARTGREAKDRRPEAGASDDGWLLELLAQVARRPAGSVSPASRLVQDLGFDSLMLTELSVALEQAGAELPEGEDVTKLETVAELSRALRVGARSQHRERDEAALEPVSEEISVPAPIAAAGRAFLGQAQRFLYESLFETKVVGRAYIPQSGSFLVAANHSSHLDMGLVKIAMGPQGERLAALAARDYFFSTPLRRAYFGNFTKLIPMDRQGSLKASLRLAGEAIANGLHLLIFPEGTRSPDGTLGEFKPTLGYLALNHGVDVLPAAILGTYEALPKGRVVPKSRELEVVFGPPVTIAELRSATEGLPRSEAYRVATELVQQAVEKLLRREAPGPRPHGRTAAKPAPDAGSSADRGEPAPRAAKGRNGEDLS